MGNPPTGTLAVIKQLFLVEEECLENLSGFYCGLCPREGDVLKCNILLKPLAVVTCHSDETFITMLNKVSKQGHNWYSASTWPKVTCLPEALAFFYIFFQTKLSFLHGTALSQNHNVTQGPCVMHAHRSYWPIIIVSHCPICLCSNHPFYLSN